MEFNYLLTLIGSIIIIAIDSTYLYFNMNFYKDVIDPSVKMNLIYAVLVWILIIVSIQLLVLSRDNLTQGKVLLYGILLGLAMYGMYNLTNAAMYPNKWKLKLILGDTTWGMIITGFMSVILYNIGNSFNKKELNIIKAIQ